MGTVMDVRTYQGVVVPYFIELSNIVRNAREKWLLNPAEAILTDEEYDTAVFELDLFAEQIINFFVLRKNVSLVFS